MYDNCSSARFRPLAGFWFLNSADTITFDEATIKFPSPCGVLVLKSMTLARLDYIRIGFRPLAGFWFLKPFAGRVAWIEEHVSVPLRGSGS